MTTVIEAHDLVKTFGRTRALDGLDLSVDEGEVHGFLGPNGAGKSTTIRVLLGMLRRRSGTATVFGRDPWRDAVAIHRDVAYVPGDVSLWPNLSGGETIDFLTRLRGGADKDLRARLLRDFDLDPKKKGRSYSKGNRQKVALVAAFARPAKLYILDEPTSGLDPVMESVFRAEIERVQKDGATVLLSSHILSEVEQLCDRVTIVRAGKAVETGTLSETAAPHPHRASGSATARSSPTCRSSPGVHDARAEADQLVFDADTDAVNGVLRRPHQGRRQLAVGLAAVARGAVPAALRRPDRDRSRPPDVPHPAPADPPGSADPPDLDPRHRRLLLGRRANSVVSEYGDAEGARRSCTVALATPALLALRGIPNGDSLGSAVHFQSFAFLAVTIGLMNTFLATRHGRADEEKGRRELVAATPVSRLAPPRRDPDPRPHRERACSSCSPSRGYQSAGLDAGGRPPERDRPRRDRARLPRPRHARGRADRDLPRRERRSARSSCSASYALRAGGDALGTPDIAKLTLTPAWPSWLSPIGWGQQTLAFTETDWWPVALDRRARRRRGRGRARRARASRARREPAARAGRARGRPAGPRLPVRPRLAPAVADAHRMDRRLGAARSGARIAGHRDRRTSTSTTRRSRRSSRASGTPQGDLGDALIPAL